MEGRIKTEYQRDMYHNYLVLYMEEASVSEYYEKIFLHNEIQGLLPFEWRIFNNKRYAYYEINGKQSLSCIFEKKAFSIPLLVPVIEDIMQILHAGKEYLLKECDYILSPDKIYVELPKLKVSLCYFPGYHINLKEQLQCLLEYFMNHLDYNDQETVVLIYRLYMQSKEENITMKQLQCILQEVKESKGEIMCPKEKKVETSINDKKEIGEIKDIKVERLPFVAERFDSEKEFLYYPLSCYVIMVISIIAAILFFIFLYNKDFMLNKITSRPDFIKNVLLFITEILFLFYIGKKLFHKDKRLSKMIPDNTYNTPNSVEEIFHTYTLDTYENKEEEEKTVLLSQFVEEHNPKLTPMESDKYETIVLNEFPFFVGNLKTHMDYNIESNSISRFHAKILKEGNDYFLVDLNSTNGTYVNGKQIKGQEKAKIMTGDKIMFANILYFFSC